MDKNVIEGKAKQVVGAARQKVGEVIDNREMQVKGAAQRVEGHVQESYGKGKDQVREAAKKFNR